MTKPAYASEYSREQAELVRATCPYVATKLGDLMNDLVVVGGLVPSLIVDQSAAVSYAISSSISPPSSRRGSDAPSVTGSAWR